MLTSLTLQIHQIKVAITAVTNSDVFLFLFFINMNFGYKLVSAYKVNLAFLGDIYSIAHLKSKSLHLKRNAELQHLTSNEDKVMLTPCF